MAIYNTTRAAKRMARLQRVREAASAAAVRNPELLPADGGLAAVSYAAARDAALTNQFPYSSYANRYRIAGGKPTSHLQRAGYYLFPVAKIGNAAQVGTDKGAGTTGDGTNPVFTTDAHDQANGWEVSFTTNAEVVELQVLKEAVNPAVNPGVTEAGQRQYLVMVNGQFVDKVGANQSALSGVHEFIKLSFAALPDPRATKTITLVGFGSATGFFGVSVGPTAAIAYPGSTSTELKALWFGDSFCEGQNVGDGKFTIAARMSRRLGISRWFNMCIGTTGYINNGGARRTLLNQLLDVPVGGAANGGGPMDAYYADPDVVFVANGFNDKGSVSVNTTFYANLRAGALAAFQQLRIMYPDTLIVVFGAWPGRTVSSFTAPASLDSAFADRAIKEAFDLFADPFSTFIYTSDHTQTQPYSFGTGKREAPTGDGDADIIMSNDGTHPYLTGADAYASRGAGEVRTALAKLV